jgi:hypothetical protein
LKSINISSFGQINGPVIYEILYPFCRGDMIESLIKAIKDKETLDQFHDRVLRQFVPNRLLQQLRAEKYERVQRLDKPLSMYVRAVRDAALVPRINETESQTVARIVEGLTPDQRARFLFQEIPTTFHQLEKLAVVDRNVMYADQTRRGEVAATTKDAGAARDTRTGNSGHHPVSRTPVGSKQLFCYHCGKAGHLRNSCFQRSVKAQSVGGKPPVKPRQEVGTRKIGSSSSYDVPKIEAQVGQRVLSVLIDTGSMKSLISFEHYSRLNIRGAQPRLLSTEVNCVTASGQDLEIMGQVKVPLKINGFSLAMDFPRE